jgi:hypothetical protein
VGRIIAKLHHTIGDVGPIGHLSQSTGAGMTTITGAYDGCVLPRVVLRDRVGGHFERRDLMFHTSDALEASDNERDLGLDPIIAVSPEMLVIVMGGNGMVITTYR